MRAKKYFLALVFGSLGLLITQPLGVAPAQAEPPASAPAKRAPTAKPPQRRAVRPDFKALLKLQVTANRLPVVAIPMPSRKDQSGQPRPKRGPYLDMEGLVIWDMHVQPNIMFMTDTRYENSSTRERAQRDEIDWLAARQNGECHQGQDPLNKLLRAREQKYQVRRDDPGFDVATTVNHKLQETPPKPVANPAPAGVVAKRGAPRPQLAKR